mmetsp:Transcript_10635/g.34795  ORF Transcript_10635/g.34795 Transcript_10635/m.34795 type:complete len:231 (+) Transcript_10635:50-742(+)
MWPRWMWRSQRPGRISAGSNFSGWFVVMIMRRPGESTTPSNTFRTPDRSRRSASSLGAKSVDVAPVAASSAAMSARSLETGSASAAIAGGGGFAASSSAASPRLRTTEDAASTSSRTKIVCRKVSDTAQSTCATLNLRSKTASMSSWFVWTLVSGIETTFRPVRCAMALMSDVLPVPGGPCNRTPSLCGNPATAYFPRFAWKASSKDRSLLLSLKKRDSKVFVSPSGYRL